MKKTVIVILIMVTVILSIITMKMTQIAQNRQDVQSLNSEYEKYKDKNLYGIDIVTVINKAVDNNEKNSITKDVNGSYQENEENSIKVNLKLIASVDEKTGEVQKVTHEMERIIDVGLEGFITNFNLTIFRLEEIEYHKKTGRISKITFEQIEE